MTLFDHTKSHRVPVNRPLLIVSVAFGLFLLFAPNIFAASVTLSPRLTLGEQYTDNVLLSAVDEEYDFITTVSPGFTLGSVGRKLGASLSYDPEQSFYARNSYWDTLRHRGQFDAFGLLSRNTRMDINDTFRYTEDPIDEGDPSVRRSRAPYYVNSASAYLTHLFGRENSVRIGYRYRLLNNVDPGIEDNEGHEPSLLLDYWFVPNEWLLTSEMSYIRGEYDGITDDFDRWFGSLKLTRRFSRHVDGYVQYLHTVYDYDGETEGYKLYNPSVGIVYSYDEDTRITAGIGYLVRDFEDRENRDSPVGVGDIGLTKRFTNGSVNFFINSGYRESFLDSENLGLSVYYGAGFRANYSFTRNTDGEVFIGYRDERYDNLLPWLADREDRTGRGGVNLRYAIVSWLTTRAEYLYRTLDSNYETNNYQENRATIRFTFEPERPYRYLY